jgi:hypothetical protein
MKHSFDGPLMQSEPRCKTCFSTLNQPQTCTCCGARCLPSSSEYIDSKLCKVCYDSAGEENGHLDGHHNGKDCKPYCPYDNNVECMHVLKEIGAI